MAAYLQLNIEIWVIVRMHCTSTGKVDCKNVMLRDLLVALRIGPIYIAYACICRAVIGMG